MRNIHKRGTLLFCIIFIFHCGQFSSRAQDDILLKAVEYERMAYDAEDLHTAGSALVQKAHCYALTGDYSGALKTLERVSLFSLSVQERGNLMMERSLYSMLSGNLESMDVEDASSENCDEELFQIYADAAGFVRSNWPELKSVRKAFILSFIPPFAHFYINRPGEGVVRALGDLTSVGLGVFEALSGNWVSAFLSGGVGLYEFYWKGNAKILEEVEAVNEKAMNDLAGLLSEHIAPDLNRWLSKTLEEDR